MPNVLHDPEGWAEKAVGTHGRFVFLCIASVGFWGLVVFGIRLAVKASVLHATIGEPLSMLQRGVWGLVYAGTFFACVVLPVIYLTGLRGVLIALRTKRKNSQG